MKVAVIGCATIANSQHLPAYTKNPLAEVKYVVDVLPERAEAAAQKFNVPNFTTDYKKLLDDEELEAVSICTPNHTHASIAIDFLNAGKHVLCEKPAAVNYEQARQMKEAADRNGKILNIGVVNRFNTSVNKVKQLIDRGELGNLYHIYCSFRTQRAIPGLGGPFTTKELSGGGVLIDWGVHFFDLIFYCLGQPGIRTVTGGTHCALGKDIKNYTYVTMWAGPPNENGTYDVEDFVTGMIRTDGPTISFNGAWAQNIAEKAMFVEFLGDKAGIRLEYGGDFKLYSSKDGMLTEESFSYPKADMFYEEIDSFLKCAKANRKNRASIDHAILASEVMEAVYQSAALGREVQL